MIRSNDIFHNCLLCDKCLNDKLLALEPEKYYLPTPWQGEISGKVSILFLSINPSPTVCSNANLSLIEQAEKGYSIKYEDFIKLEESGKNKISELIYSTLANAENRKRLEQSLEKRKSIWTITKKVAASLMKIDVSNIREYSDYILSEVIHCQTQTVNELGESFSEIANICFRTHTMQIIKMLMSLEWIVISGKPAQNFILSKNIIKLLSEEFKIGEQIFEDKIFLNKTIFYIKITDKIKLLFIPFMGNGQWKSEYYNILNNSEI